MNTRRAALHLLFVTISFLLGIGMAQAQTAPAADTADPATQRQAIETRLAELQTKKALSIAGIVVGGVAVIAGAVQAYNEAEDEAEREAQQTGYGEGESYNWIGLAIGIPVIVISTYTLISASRESNSLRRQKVRLSYDPRSESLGVRVAWEFP